MSGGNPNGSNQTVSGHPKRRCAALEEVPSRLRHGVAVDRQHRGGGRRGLAVGGLRRAACGDAEPGVDAARAATLGAERPATPSTRVEQRGLIPASPPPPCPPWRQLPGGGFRGKSEILTPLCKHKNLEKVHSCAVRILKTMAPKLFVFKNSTGGEERWPHVRRPLCPPSTLRQSFRGWIAGTGGKGTRRGCYGCHSALGFFEAARECSTPEPKSLANMWPGGRSNVTLRASLDLQTRRETTGILGDGAHGPKMHAIGAFHYCFCFEKLAWHDFKLEQLKIGSKMGRGGTEDEAAEPLQKKQLCPPLDLN